MNDTDRLRQLVDLVAKMRAAQICYFKTGGGIDDAKKLERALDRWLADYRRELAGDAGAGQRPLFGEALK
jgi:hypothetical protein